MTRNMKNLKVGETIVAMARGTLILDENLRSLEPALIKKNIRVFHVTQGMSDAQIRPFLANRIFVTNNSKDFVQYAPELDCGIIATEGVTKDTERLADIISKALTKFSLWAARHGFILELKASGKHIYKALTE